MKSLFVLALVFFANTTFANAATAASAAEPTPICEQVVADSVEQLMKINTEITSPYATISSELISYDSSTRVWVYKASKNTVRPDGKRIPLTANYLIEVTYSLFAPAAGNCKILKFELQ